MNMIVQYPGTAILYSSIVAFAYICEIIAERSSKTSKIWLVIAVLVLSLLCGLRGITVGTDTLAYYKICLVYGEERHIQWELGFKYLVKILMLIFEHPNVVFFVVSLITNSLIFARLWSLRFVIRFSTTALFYTLNYYFSTFSGIRQWLAISIVFYGLGYVFELKLFKYFIIVLMATMFHTSAFVSIVFIPIGLLFSKQATRKKKLFLIFTIILFPIIAYILSIVSDFFMMRYGSMLKPDELYRSVGFGYMGIIKLLLLILIFIFEYNKFNIKENINNTLNNNYILNIANLAFFIEVITNFVGYFMNDITRITMYMIPMYMVLLGSVFHLKRHKTYSLYLVRFIVLLIGFYSFYTVLAKSGNEQIPYIPFWKQ